MNKQTYKKKVEELIDKEARIIQFHMSNCFQRFANEIFKLNKMFDENGS